MTQPATVPVAPDGEAGFTLVESLIAMVITAVGVMAIATTFLYGIQLQAGARNGTRRVNLAVSELERLRMLPVAHADRANGGSLTANVANHFAVRGGTTVRWVVADGPACGPSIWAGPTLPVECTKTVTVIALGADGTAITGSIDGQLWR
jgi:prepilin-type N-terminal cleavage/methylation domain-containing protein